MSTKSTIAAGTSSPEASAATNLNLGLVVVGRPTFDIAVATRNARLVAERLTALADSVAGDSEVATDVESVRERVRAMISSPSTGDLDAIIVFFSTFTDATLPLAATEAAGITPLVLWSVPEERTGGRLGTNGFCGVNLASFSLRRRDRRFAAIHSSPAQVDADDLARAVTAATESAPLPSRLERAASSTGAQAAMVDAVVASVANTTIGVLGSPPDGFEPCQHPTQRCQWTDARFDDQPLGLLFEASDQTSDETLVTIASRVNTDLDGLDNLDQPALGKSIRLFGGLTDLVKENHWDGVAVRCWPECMTEYGGAACAPMSMLNSDGTPGACEADAYGSLTMVLLTEIAGEPAFLADLVDLDHKSNTGAFWHCGLAPLEFADPAQPPTGINHTNRDVPLLHQFGLRPGRVTIARLSNAPTGLRMVIGSGEVVEGAAPFLGTSGVVRFDGSTKHVFDTIVGAGLEHHYGLVYGDHGDVLEAVAARWNIPVLRLNVEHAGR